MSIKSRIAQLETRHGGKAINGRLLFAWAYPNDEVWQVTQAAHREKYPNHMGIRFIDNVSLRDALYDRGAWSNLTIKIHRTIIKLL